MALTDPVRYCGVVFADAERAESMTVLLVVPGEALNLGPLSIQEVEPVWAAILSCN